MPRVHKTVAGIPPEVVRDRAHLRPLGACSAAGCTRPYTQALYNGLNAHMGNYCDQHAGRALRAYKRGEEPCKHEHKVLHPPGDDYCTDCERYV